jgi:phosphotransferase system  glucose/maltose/N-acetylglucosamine-specific IIC component
MYCALFCFLISLLVSVVGSFFLGNSYDIIGYSRQNFIGGIIGLIISGILFISATLFLATSNIKRTNIQPLNTTTPLNTRAHSFDNNIQEPRVNYENRI